MTGTKDMLIKRSGVRWRFNMVEILYLMLDIWIIYMAVLALALCSMGIFVLFIGLIKLLSIE